MVPSPPSRLPAPSTVACNTAVCSTVASSTAVCSTVGPQFAAPQFAAPFTVVQSQPCTAGGSQQGIGWNIPEHPEYRGIEPSTLGIRTQCVTARLKRNPDSDRITAKYKGVGIANQGLPPLWVNHCKGRTLTHRKSLRLPSRRSIPRPGTQAGRRRRRFCATPPAAAKGRPRRSTEGRSREQSNRKDRRERETGGRR